MSKNFLTHTPVAEIPGLGWTESVHPRFATYTTVEALGKIANLTRREFWQSKKLQLQDAGFIKHFHSVLDEVSEGGVDEFLQVGAHDGSFDDPFAKYISKFTHSVLVEPQTEQYEKLVAKYSGNPRVSLRRAAVAEHSGTLTLFRAQIEGADEFGTAIASKNSEQVLSEVERCLGKSSLSKTQIEQEVVPAVTMAELLSSELSDPNTLTILASDTEGSDAVVVKGALAECGIKPPIILYEHLHVPATDNQELVRELGALGYQLSSSHKDTLAVL